MLKAKVVFAIYFTVIVCTSHGQQFKKFWKESISTSLSEVQMEWVSLDPDTLLDVVLVGKASDGEIKIISYRNTGVSLVEQNSLPTGLILSHFELADWNHDNHIDVLISGRTSSGEDAIFVFTNNNNFSFTKESVKLLAHDGLFKVVDFNDDGQNEILISGGSSSTYFIKIYTSWQGTLHVVYDTLNMATADIVTADFNRDGFLDFVVSGTIASTPVTRCFLNKRNLKFVSVDLQNPVSGPLSAIDQNADGKVDLFASGSNNGTGILQAWRNNGIRLLPYTSWPAPQGAQLFTGDMNNDGLVDQMVYGVDSNGDPTNYIQDSNSMKILLGATRLLTQRAGDFDRDGDLDILQLMDSSGSQWMKLLKNQITARNRRPSNANNAFAISFFNRTFLYWQHSTDDLTDSLSLTYDVWIGSSDNTVLSSGFDLTTGRRAIVAHGNAGTMKSKVIEGLLDNRYFFNIQTVDNAYNGSYSQGNGGSGFCHGVVQTCFDLVHETIQACRGESIVLKADALAHWFSVSGGFIKIDLTYSFKATASDTIFFFTPNTGDCSKNKVWVLQVHEGPPIEQEILYACEGQTVKLGIEPGWENVEWNTTPVTRDVDIISLQVEKSIEVIARGLSSASDGKCPYTKKFEVRVSIPELTVNGEVFKILKGQNVQLEALSSQGSQFLWSPAEGLDRPSVADPIAEPRHTIDYTVTATDSIGCKKTVKVQVQVEESSFIPNLFTPDGDGNNDTLLIYGLTDGQGFQLTIYNREGKLVYETRDVTQAVSQGWNGYTAGTQQPSGVYYWRVEGTTSLGKEILLNGKKMGSVTLVH